jgi:hypothetical protein
MRAFAIAVVVAAACSGGMTKEQAAREVDQMIALYTDNRPKFVVQKEEMVKAGDCTRAEMLKAAIDDKARTAAMSPENTETITLVQMELAQAEKDCRAK